MAQITSRQKQVDERFQQNTIRRIYWYEVWDYRIIARVYNTALLSVLSGMKYETTFCDSRLWGRWVESSIGTYLLNNAEELEYKLFYWRERNDEVDFIIEHNSKCIAIEVKSGRRTTNNGIKIFKEKFKPHKTFIVGTGGLPIEDFLSLDIEKLFME